MNSWVAADVPNTIGRPDAAESAVLAEAVVRAERSLARQAARTAAGPRIVAVRYADALAVLALLLPWTTPSRGGAAPELIARNGLQSSGLVASLALMGIVLRQVVLTAVAAQPDRRAPMTLTLVGAVTGGASVLVLVRLPALAQRHGVVHVEFAGPLLYGTAAAAAAVFTVMAGRAIATARPAPDLLAGLYLATADEIRVRLEAVDIAIRHRTTDPLPAAGVLGLIVATAGAQAQWADPLGLRWLIGVTMAAVMVLAVSPMKRSAVARAQVLAGGLVMLLTLRALLLVRSGVGEANGAWLSLSGAVVTTLCGIAVLLGRHARRVRVP